MAKRERVYRALSHRPSRRVRRTIALALEKAVLDHDYALVPVHPTAAVMSRANPRDRDRGGRGRQTAAAVDLFTAIRFLDCGCTRSSRCAG